MSNKVNVQYTKFIDIDEEGKELSSTFGYRIYDDYGQEYLTMFGSTEDLKKKINPDTIFDVIENEHEEFYEAAMTDGLYLNGVRYIFLLGKVHEMK